MATTDTNGNSAEPIQEVRPGQLITAAFMNDLVDLVNSLSAKVDALPTPATLEAADLPVIENVYHGDAKHTAMQIAVGQPATIVGKNLVPFSVVRIDNIPYFEPADAQGHSDGSITISRVKAPGNRSPNKLALIAVTNDTGSGSRIVALN